MAKTNSFYSPIRGKGNSNKERRRPPNKFCRYCGRKKVYSEKYCSKWVYPCKQTCFDCVMVRDGLLNYVNEEKLRKKENALRFPLTIHDNDNDIFVGQYNSKRKTQLAINRYQLTRRRNTKIAVIHYADRFEFTDRFTNTS